MYEKWWYLSIIRVSTTAFSQTAVIYVSIDSPPSITTSSNRSSSIYTMTTEPGEEETVVPGGTGGKSYEAQQHLAEGRSRGGQTRRDQQLGTEGYQEIGRKVGLSSGDQSGRQRAKVGEGIDVDESSG
ncbi:hypothetical protein L1987_15657 [Smallanthus sonchifolius]|uniref:Uncharacterized protein n=1 Tax=Smallanthus sonchifolius TaxID=185202 RepID=A0ACB9J8G2_9ASTR|nr:hypothetical protein L1987_15657 [Smallanthus sonchifolius]